MSLCNREASVVRLSVRPSVCPSVSKLFCANRYFYHKHDWMPPNLHTMVPTWTCIQGVLKVKVKGQVIRTLFWLHENRFFYTTNMIGSPANLHNMVPTRACIQDVLKVNVKVKGHVIRALLWCHEMFAIDSTFWRSVSTCTHFTKHRYTLLPVQVSDS